MFLLSILKFVGLFFVISSQSCPSNNCKCFDEFNGKHLTTFAKRIEGRTEEECRGSCLTFPDLCASAQYDRTNKLCYLNTITHLSNPSMWQNRNNYVYWYRRSECHPNCYFTYHWKKYLLGYNDNSYLSYSSFQCLETCILNQNYDCKSIDYNRLTGACTLSRESKDTKPTAFLSHISLEHFHKICKSDNIETTPCYAEKLDGQYLINRAKLYTNRELDACQRLCLTATFICRSIHYDKSTKNCYLNKETHVSKPNWIRFNSNYVYFIRDQKCEFSCYFVYNWRRFIQGYKLGGQLTDTTSLQCMEQCYEDQSCKSFDYDRTSKICQLHTESKLTKPGALKYSATYENFHKLCTVSKNYKCFNSFSKKYLNDRFTGFDDKSEEECIKLCMFSGLHCRSVSYNKRTRKCYISRKTRHSHSNLYLSDNDYRYFGKKSVCLPECVALTFANYYLQGYKLKELTANNDVDCLYSCLTYTPKGYCKSVSWKPSTKTCSLHDQTRLTRRYSFKPSNQYTHWDIVCSGKCFTEYPYKYLSNQAYADILTTEEKCKYYCLTSTEGCRSAFYDRSSEKCYLTKHTRLTKPNSFYSNANRIYWERKAICQPNYYFDYSENRYLQGNNNKEFKVYDTTECLELCLTETSFTCKSAELNKRTNKCYLSDESRQTVSYALWKSSSQFDYYERRPKF